MQSKKCLVCGDVFFKKPSESKQYWITKKYCSWTCSITKTSITFLIKSRQSDWNKGRKPWNKGISVRLSPKSEFKKGHKSNLGRVFAKGIENPNWKQKVVICDYCKKDIFKQPNAIRVRNFCNRQCWALGTRGEGSPMFKGELATKPLRHRVMELPEYKEWRSKCLIRDNYTCQECGFRNKGKECRKMEVDHLKRYYHIIKENDIITTKQARSCKELWETKNGRTLCRECHRKSNTYGTTGLKFNRLSVNL